MQILRRLERGEGTEEDLDTLLDICDNILGRSFCALGDGAASPIMSSIQYFRDEYIAHLTDGRLPVRPGRLDRVRSQRLREDRRQAPMTVTSGTRRSVRDADDLVTLTIDGIEIRCPRARW